MLGAARIERDGGDAAADGYLEKLPAHRVGFEPGLDILAEPFRDEPRIGLLRVGQDDAELVTADATRQVGGAHVLTDQIAQRPQHPVSHPRAVRVVDLLELVEVEEQQRQRSPGATAAVDLPLQRVLEVAPIVQAGERIRHDQALDRAERRRVDDRHVAVMRVDVREVVEHRHALADITPQPPQQLATVARRVSPQAFRLRFPQLDVGDLRDPVGMRPTQRGRREHRLPRIVLGHGPLAIGLGADSWHVAYLQRREA